MEKPSGSAPRPMPAGIQGADVSMGSSPPPAGIRSPKADVSLGSPPPTAGTRVTEGSEQGIKAEEGPPSKKRRVVREIDVIVTPEDPKSTQLYLLQYPLRPSWRPYELEKRCQEIRMKPKQARVEVDLAVDTAEREYDPEAPEHLRINSQTLTSSHIDLPATYAVGILQGNRLHLTPLHAVVQLRPSLAYLDDAATRPPSGLSAWQEQQQQQREERAQRRSKAKGKAAAAEAGAGAGEGEEGGVGGRGGEGEEEGGPGEGDGDPMEEGMEDGEDKDGPVAVEVQVHRKETEEQEAMRLQSHAHVQAELDREPWLELTPFGPSSREAGEVLARLRAAGDGPQPGPGAFQTRQEYLAELVKGTEKQQGQLEAPSEAASEAAPGAPGGGAVGGIPLGPAGLSRSFLNTLPLDARLHALLSQARTHIFQFERIMKVAPEGCAERAVLGVLQQKALLVQGCWVAASSLRYGQGNPVCVVRDFILLRFTKNRVIQNKDLEHLKVPKELLRELLQRLAVQRGPGVGWEFLESCDRAFLKHHVDVARAQAQRWHTAEAGISRAAAAVSLPSMAHVAAATAAAAAKVAAAQQPGLRGRPSGFGAPKAVSYTAPAPPGGARAHPVVGSPVPGFGRPREGGAQGFGALGAVGAHQGGRGRGGALAGQPGVHPQGAHATGQDSSSMVPAQGAVHRSVAGPGGRTVTSSTANNGTVDGHGVLAFGAPRASPGPGPVMSEETRQALGPTLRTLFAKHPICTLPFLCQCLREHAQLLAAADAGSGKHGAAVATAVAAARAANAPPSELALAVSKVATNIGPLYFLPETGDPALDPFRTVVVSLLRAKGPGGGLRKNEILDAAKRTLNMDVPPTTYQKVLKELCFSKGGGVWMLKPGDGRPM